MAQLEARGYDLITPRARAAEARHAQQRCRPRGPQKHNRQQATGQLYAILAGGSAVSRSTNRAQRSWSNRVGTRRLLYEKPRDARVHLKSEIWCTSR